MDEREFVEQRQSSWQRLQEILKRASAGGLKALSRRELSEIGPLYRRAASDLAYARAHAVSGSLKSHLNVLVARSYALLYQADTRSWSGLRDFLWRDFPRTFRRRLPFFLAAVGFVVLGAVVSYLLVAHSPDNMDIWAPPGSPERENLNIWASGQVSRRASDAQNSIYASFLMTHNIQVSFIAFALGIVGDVLTALVLFANGTQLGAYTAWMYHVHQVRTWWPGILPHGVVELSETCIAGAAGLSLGWALLAPGRWRRRDALVMAALDSVRLIFGGMALLVFAGLVEGFVSHSMLAPNLKITFGILSGVALYGYLFLAGRDRPSAADEPVSIRAASSPSLPGSG